MRGFVVVFLLAACAPVRSSDDGEWRVPADDAADVFPCAAEVTAEVPYFTITDAEVWVWNGDAVYRVWMRTAEGWSVVYDLSCTYACAPSGGYTGQGDGLCPDFEDEAAYSHAIGLPEPS